MLVRISPRKKSLNLTTPNGAIIFSQNEYMSSNLNALYITLSGLIKSAISVVTKIKVGQVSE
jgi:hypothetical protein